MTEEQNQDMSDEEAIAKIAEAMKSNSPVADEKHNVHTFLTSVVQTDDIEKVIKLGNLRDDKELNEIGLPNWTLRGSEELALISGEIMENNFFKEYFNKMSAITTTSSLSREGFLIRQASTQTKQVADVTKRRKVFKNLFTTKEETSGGDTTGGAISQ